MLNAVHRPVDTHTPISDIDYPLRCAGVALDNARRDLTDYQVESLLTRLTPLAGLLNHPRHIISLEKLLSRTDEMWRFSSRLRSDDAVVPAEVMRPVYYAMAICLDWVQPREGLSYIRGNTPLITATDIPNAIMQTCHLARTLDHHSTLFRVEYCLRNINFCLRLPTTHLPAHQVAYLWTLLSPLYGWIVNHEDYDSWHAGEISWSLR